MSAYSEFFLSTASAVAELELIDIFHPNFDKVYYIVRNQPAGVTVTLEDATERDYKFYPLDVRPIGFRDDLDQGFAITIGDTGDTLPAEIERVLTADGTNVYPTFTYRSYRADNLTAPLFGPVNLVIESVSFTEEGATFNAVAPSLNRSRTGELYRLDRFPMLRGLL